MCKGLLVVTLLSRISTIFEDKSKHIPFLRPPFFTLKDSISFSEHFKYPPNILYQVSKGMVVHMGQKCQISSQIDTFHCKNVTKKVILQGPKDIQRLHSLFLFNISYYCQCSKGTNLRRIKNGSFFHTRKALSRAAISQFLYY